MQFSLLGPLEVSKGNRPVRLGLGRRRNVLILLLLHRNEAVSSERLVDTLWGETPPPTAAKVLQNYVSQLRRALGDRDGRRLQTRGHGYALRVDDGELDLDRFERLVGEHGGSLAHDRPAEAAVRLREALALWRGPALADVAYEAFAQGEIARLEERRSVALESASTPTWRSGATPTWWPSLRRSSPSGRCASTCAANGWSRCTAVGARRRRLRRSARAGACWSTRSVSSPARSL